MGPSFSLMTANLLHERCDVDDFSRVLNEMSPDVLVTQELAPSCAEVIQGFYSNHQLRPSIDFTGRGIATRFDAEFGDIEMPGRNGTSARLDVDGTTMRLAGVHLLNPIHFPWWSAAAVRRRQLEGLMGWLDEGSRRPVMVAGDFNASPAWPAYKRVAEKLTDLVAARAEDEGTSPSPTWGWRPGWPRLLRIDHVFGLGMRATAVRVEPIAGTDHAAVMVDAELDAR